MVSNCLTLLMCSKKKDRFGTLEPIQGIKDIFIKPTFLKNGELIEYKGKGKNYDYYLFEFGDRKIYIKKSENGFSLCNNLDELYDEKLLFGQLSKIPDQGKLLKSSEMIKRQDKTIYTLNDGLRLCHINSTYIQTLEEKQSVLTFEYLIVHYNFSCVLMYNHYTGFGLIEYKQI